MFDGDITPIRNIFYANIAIEESDEELCNNMIDVDGIKKRIEDKRRTKQACDEVQQK